MIKGGIAPEGAGSISLKSKIKIWCLNGLIIHLFVLVLGLCSLPTVFYFTAEKLEPSNSSIASNMTRNGRFSHWLNYPQNISICNKPLIEYKKNNLSICVPPCGWKPWNEKQSLEINATTYTACFLSLFSFTLALLTWFKIPQLWRYPHFIIVIMLGQSTIIVCIAAVATLLGNDVYCSSKFSIPGMKATTYCKFQGVLIHYLEGSILLWFVAYNVVVAKGLVFDKVHAANDQNRWYFLISALVCWLPPIIPVIFVLVSKDGYSVSFYSNYCFPSSLELVYYTAILPENILFAIGVSFLYIVIWKLLKERRAPVIASLEQARLRKNKMNNVVTRLTLLMLFYAVTVFLSYGGICYLIHQAKAFETAIKVYFDCLIIRPTCSPDYKQFISHIPIVLDYIAAGIFPVSTMLFLAANEKARELWKKPYYRLRRLTSCSQEQSLNRIARSTSVTHLLNENKQLLGHA